MHTRSLLTLSASRCSSKPFNLICKRSFSSNGGRSIVSELEVRGLLAQVSNRAELEAVAQRSALTAYAGFDPTAASLHVGNLLLITVLERFRRAGHRAIALVGGATGAVGDPSGRATERSLLSEPLLAANTSRVRAQLERLFGAEAVVDNADWWRPISALELLRDIGKQHRVNAMLARESVKQRLAGEGLSFTEFAYQLLQAYDFFHLHTKHGCNVQLGGSDQWGNICAGLDHIQHYYKHQQPQASQGQGQEARAWGVTMPLITGKDGTKLGKSAGNVTVWLDAQLTSPYEFYQFFHRTSDAQLGPMLKYFTFEPVEALGELVAKHLTAPEKRAGQAALARLVTTYVHGAEATQTAERVSAMLFGSASPAELLDASTAAELARVVPVYRQPADALSGVSLVTLAANSGLVKSKSEARRLATSGGLYLNGTRVGVEQKLRSEDLLAGGFALLRAGAKEYRLVAVGAPEPHPPASN